MNSGTSWSRGQLLAGEQLISLAAASSNSVELLSGPVPGVFGHAEFEVSLSLAGLPHAAGGIRVRDRERFVIWVPPDFPFKVPMVCTRHRRWAGTPHVQWGRHLCLYLAPSVEWSAADGMRGLVDRLVLWLEKAALGQLDPDGQPLHPPVAYPLGGMGRVVVHADLGPRAPEIGVKEVGQLIGLCEQTGDRLDVVGWMDATEYATRLAADDPPADLRTGRPFVAAAAVLLGEQIGFEYPFDARQLMQGLAGAGLTRADLLEVVGLAAHGNAASATARGVTPGSSDADQDDGEPEGPGGAPLVVLVGTPSRRLGDGPRLIHLVGWRFNEVQGRLAALLGDIEPGRSTRLDELRREVIALGEQWIDIASIMWVELIEDRPEVTRRRDGNSSAAWLNGKKVLVLGCGALGAPAAEVCVRAGAGYVEMVDNGIVTPGVLVRQPYTDADIGQYKATALARRLRTLRRAAAVRERAEDAITAYLQPTRPAPAFDLVIDATADSSVRAALEHARANKTDDWPPVITMVIGHQARRGVLALARRGATGAGHDILRRLGIAVRTTHAASFADVAADLYPHPPRTEMFLPEPGCSAPTFVGSAAEVTALSGALLTAALDALAGSGPAVAAEPMSAAVVRLDTGGGAVPVGGMVWIGWPNDFVVSDAAAALQVRLTRISAQGVGGKGQVNW